MSLVLFRSNATKCLEGVRGVAKKKESTTNCILGTWYFSNDSLLIKIETRIPFVHDTYRFLTTLYPSIPSKSDWVHAFIPGTQVFRRMLHSSELYFVFKRFLSPLDHYFWHFLGLKSFCENQLYQLFSCRKGHLSRIRAKKETIQR